MLYEDFLKYRDGDGWNVLDTDRGIGVPCQNGALFTFEYLICLLNDESVPQELKESEVKRIKYVFHNLERLYGYTYRASWSDEFDSMDNTVAWLAFSALFDNGEFANRMLLVGQNVCAEGVDETQDAEKNKKFFPFAKLLNFGTIKNYWNNQNPELFCFQGWFGRSPAMLGLLRMTANKWCNPFLWLSVLVGQFVTAFKDPTDTDARKLPYVCWQYLRTRSKFWELMYKLWCFILLKYYPNGMKDVYDIYYLDKNHPIIKYSKQFV